MKTRIITTSALAVTAFCLGLGFNSAALSDAINTNVIKIGVVDVAKVVENSSDVKALKKQQDAKKAELAKWLNTVRADIQKQSTPENKAKLAKKYDAELAKKQQAIRAESDKKATEIDRNISKTIQDTAKAQGYTIVFSKNVVLYGGDDLTQAVSKAVK